MRPLALVILDGWGIAPPGPGNVISLAKLPNYTNLWFSFPHTTLVASGEAVGLPRGEVGNTETGHLNLSAGRIVYQDLPRINMSIADGSFFRNTALLSAINHAQKTGGNLHIAGLIGSGGVHSNIEHLFALLHLCREQQFDRVFLHAFTDGRDSPPGSALVYIDQVKRELHDFGIGAIATVMGRYYAMDRDNRWDRTEKAYKAIVYGEGIAALDVEEGIRQAYGSSLTDEFIQPIVITTSQSEPLARVVSGDSLIFFNFRVDRLRQLTKTFVYDDFEEKAQTKTSFDPYSVKYFKKHLVDAQEIRHPFIRGSKIPNLFVVTMTEYEQNLPVDGVAFPTQQVVNTLGEVVSNQGFRQLRASETEKERFVTYYFSGQREGKFPGEDWLIMPSPKVATYDLKPEMSSYELTDSFISELESQKYQLLVVNYANPDMVGHTGMIQPAIKACEAVDVCLGKLTQAVLKQNGYCIITADHGNVEGMLHDGTGAVETEHSRSPVPFIAIANEWQGQSVDLERGILGDVATTIMQLMGLPKPSEMTGKYLLR